MSAVGADPPTAGPTTTSGADGPLATTAIPQSVFLSAEDWLPPGKPATDRQPFPPTCTQLPSEAEFASNRLYTLDRDGPYSFTIPGTNANTTGHELILNLLLYYPSTVTRPPEFEFQAGVDIVVNGVVVAPSRTQAEASCGLMVYNAPVDASVNERGVTGTLHLSSNRFLVNARLPRMLVTSAAARFMQVVGPPKGSTLSLSLGGTLTVNPPTISRSSVQDTSVPSSGANASSPSSGSGGPKASVIVPAVLVPLLVIAVGALVFVLWRRRRRSRMAPSAAFRADHPEGMVAVHRDDGAVGYAGGATSPILAQSPTPAQSSPYFPYDNKRPFTP